MPSTVRAEAPWGGAAVAAASAFALGLRRNLANWPILMGRALFYLAALTVLAALWDKVASQRLPGTLVSRLPPGGLLPYFAATEWISISIAAIHLRLEDDIRFGQLEPHLLRPKPYLVQKVAEAMGDSAGRLIGLGIAAIAGLLVLGHGLPPAAAFVYLIVLAPFATLVGVLLYAIAGLSAFWIRRVLPPFLIVQKLMFLLGGLFAPIGFYPGWLFRLAAATPFAANLYLAGNQMIAPSAAGFGEALLAELFWIAALSGVVALLWRAGLRKVLREGV